MSKCKDCKNSFKPLDGKFDIICPIKCDGYTSFEPKNKILERKYKLKQLFKNVKKMNTKK